MIIIETCPKCGHDLHDLVIATNQPIPQKKCFECGWEWTGEPEQVIRVPFGGNTFYPDNKYALTGSIYNELVNVDDTCCALNNINENAYKISKAKLESISGISYDDIVAAVERSHRYIARD